MTITKNDSDDRVSRDQDSTTDLNDNLEEDLLVAVQSCSCFVPPNDFLAAAVSRFENEIKHRFGVAWLTGIVAAVTLTAPLCWLAVIYIKEVVKAVALLTHATSLFLQFLVTLWRQLPEMSTGIIIALCLALFVLTVALVKVFKITLPENLSEKNAIG